MDKNKNKNSIDIDAVNGLFLDLISKDDIIVIKNMVENGFNIDSFYFEHTYGINAIIKACSIKFSGTFKINESLIYLLGLENSRVISEEAFSLLFTFGEHSCKTTKILRDLIDDANINYEITFTEIEDAYINDDLKNKCISVYSQNLFKYKGFNPKLYISALYAYENKEDLSAIDIETYCVAGLNEYNLNNTSNAELFKLALEEELKSKDIEFIKDEGVDKMEMTDFLRFCEFMREFEDIDVVPFSKMDEQLSKKLEEELKMVEDMEFNSIEDLMKYKDEFLKRMKKEFYNIKNEKKSNNEKKANDKSNTSSKVDTVSKDTSEIQVDINEVPVFEEDKIENAVTSGKAELEIKDTPQDKDKKLLEVIEVEALVIFKNLKDNSTKEEIFRANSLKNLELTISKFEEEYANSILEKEMLSKSIINSIQDDDDFTKELMEFMRTKGKL